MKERKTIQVLDDQTVNRIAAGEVVERPAAAVKELVENSLDAGATRIEVEVEMGGRQLLRVRDNGIGMARDEALLSLQRHATSKIRTAADLFSIETMGFRGEALPSIASVSRLEMISRPFEQESGTLIEVEGGEIVKVEETSAPVGTTVTARDLFFNVPARLKFLKTTATEMGHILETVMRYAFAYPEVSFRLLHDRQEILFTQGSSDLISVVASVWGREIARELVAVETEHKNVRIAGLISPPHATRPTRQYQLFYVNGRPARGKTLFAALDGAYKSLTPEKRHPICILMIEVPPNLVDVNVHPAKTEVKFQRENDVFSAMAAAVRSALLDHGMIPSALPSESTARPIPAIPDVRIPTSGTAQPPAGNTIHPPGTKVYMPDSETLNEILFQRAGLSPTPPSEPDERLDEEFDSSVPTAEQPSSDIASSPKQPSPTWMTEEPLAPRHLPFADLLDGLQILGQIANTFIIAWTNKGLVIIDQHVAHERVLYEMLCDERGSMPIQKQYLLEGAPLQLDRKSALLLQEKMQELERIGFELEPFGTDSFLIRAVPVAIAHKDYLGLLREMIEELVDISVARRLPVAREQIWTTTSCKMAVKAGDPLSMPEMQKLIEDLAKTENPYLCPHGRPITLTMTLSELEKRFKRT